VIETAAVSVGRRRYLGVFVRLGVQAFLPGGGVLKSAFAA